MKVHLVDGTYELFRCFFGAPSELAPDGREVGATRALLRSLRRLVRDQSVTHIAVAFDTVIESFRNALYQGYKTGEGVDPALLAQFPLAERATQALGMVVWPMIEFECDDALATGAARFAADPRVEQVVLCSPDKDFAQCVRDPKIALLDRHRLRLLDEKGVREKYGVSAESIPDWLALVGDAADGYPGVPRWGAKSAATVLSRWGSIARIPDDYADWDISVRGAPALAESLRAHREDALLFRRLATLRTDVPLAETLDDLAWRGVNREQLEALALELGDPDIAVME